MNTDIVITCNTQQPVAAVKAMQNELNRLKNIYKQLVQAGKENTAKGQEMQKEIRDLKIALKEGEQQLDKVNKVVQNLSQASLRQLNSALKDVKKRMNQLSSESPELEVLEQQYRAINNQITILKKGNIDLKKTLSNLDSAPLESLRRAAEKLKMQIEAAKRGTAEYAQLQAQYKNVTAEINRATGAVDKHNSAWQTTLKNMTAYFGLFQMFSLIQNKIRAVFDLNLKFSDQLADIRKVSGLAMQDINKLSLNLAQIDTRTTIEELNSIAYAGAKLGLGQYGIEGLEGFVRAANQVNVALKEDLGEDALTALSKITEVMGLIPKMGVERSMLATGSAMFQLSATSTATSNNIVEFAKRLTGMARTAGITTDQLLALGSAADSMYLMPEVASTAFNKFISSLQKNHNLIEKNLSIEPGTINNLYKAGRAVDAMVLIFSKMREKGNMNALQDIFKDLGSDGARLVNVMVTMSQNVDMLKKHLATSAISFDEATAVTNEYNIQQATANALMERAANVWEKAFVNPEGVDMVKEMAQAWYQLSKDLTNSESFMFTVRLLIDSIAYSIKNLANTLPGFIVLLGIKGAVGAWVGLKKAVDGASMSLTVAMLKTQGLNAAWKTLNATQKANVIGLIAFGLTTLITTLIDATSKIKDATIYMQGFDESIKSVQQTIGETQGELQAYFNAINNATKGSKERLAAINNFNKKYGVYLDNLLNEKSSAEELAKAYNKVNDALRNKALLEGMQSDMKNFVYNRQGWEAQQLYSYNELSKGSGKSQYNNIWLKGYVEDMAKAGKSFTEILNGISSKLGVSSGLVGTAMKNRGKAVPDGYYQTKKGVNTYAVASSGSSSTYTKFTTEEKMLFAAANYVAQRNSRVNAQNKVQKKWAPYQKEIAAASPSAITPSPQDGLEREAPDKRALTESKRQRNEQESAWREQLKEKQSEAKAIIDKIKNFYERQITEVLKTANEQNWDTALTDSAVNVVEQRMNLALSNARKSIAGVKSNWDEFKKAMDTDIKEQADADTGYNESVTLLNEIKSVDIAELRKKMAELSRNLNIPESASIDAIWKNSSLNEKANETIEQKQRKAVNARLLEDNYTAKVNDQYTQSMETMGFFNLDKQQSDTLLAGGANATAMIKARAKEIEMVLKNARENITKIYAAETRGDLIEILFGKNYDKQRSQIKAIFDLEGKDLKVFYDELIKYANDYVEAQRKAAEREKKILDQRAKTTAAHYRAINAETKASYQTRGIYQFTDAYMSQIPESTTSPTTPTPPTPPTPRTYKNGGTSFFQSFNYDPEIESLKAKMELEKQSLELAKATHASKQVIADQEKAMWDAQANYYDKLGDNLQSQIEEMTALTQPVQDFGTNIGEAFATMTTDAEAGRDAIKAAIGEMIKDFMKQTVQMAQEYIKRRIQQKMYDNLMSKQIKASADEQKKIETDKGDAVTEATENMGKDVLKQTKGQAKQLLKTKEKSTKEETKEEESKQADLTDITKSSGEAREFLNVDVEKNIADATSQIGAETLATQQAQATTEVQTESAKTQANTVMGIASGASKIIGSLGWWGIPLIAVITALLNGLLSFAMSKVSSLFGGGGGDNGNSGPNTKLVSGMLTYDSGNVQAFRGINDGKSYPVVGSDGKVYAATDGGELSTGLVKDPITTWVNGQPALVAEKGPEMVIGRETTAAMMMSRPDLLREIVAFDKHRSGTTIRPYATFDQGNLSTLSGTATVPRSFAAGQSPSSPDLAALSSVLTSLSDVLTSLQQKGIPASINMYGTGGLKDSMDKANAFLSRNRRN